MLTSAGARPVVLELDTDRVTTIAWGAVQRLGQDGIVFTTLAAEQASFGGWLSALCELDNATRDGDPAVPRSLEEFAERLATLHIDPRWCFLARVGDRYVGYTVLDAAAAEGSSIAQSWTGVRPQHRRRGIATALKEVARRAAADSGYERIRTVVRSTNVAALALNTKLGFRRAPLGARVDERIAAWRIESERVVETDRSVIVFGRRDGLPVVLKIVSSEDDESRAGQILSAFEGRGMVRVHDHIGGAVLLERLDPGHSLASLTLRGEDEEASRMLAWTIREMSPAIPAIAVPTIRDWGRSFERYEASGDTRIPTDLVTAAQRAYAELCDTQGPVRLLHGDLHHDNVLFDRERGWIAIDPKGVIGEVAFELGAALRNPHGRPDLYTDASILRTRVECFASELALDPTRILSWAFAQAVLSAIWSVEDGDPVEPSSGPLVLAHALRTEIDRPR